MNPLVASLIGFWALKAGSPPAFDCPAATADKALAQLGQALDVHLEADRTVAKQVVALRLITLDKKQALADLAKATHGEWAETKSGLRLTLSSDQMRRLWNEERDRQLQWLQPQLNRRLAELKAHEMFDANAVKALMDERKRRDDVRFFYPNAPESRAVIRTAQALGASQLAALHPGQKLVFASNPSRIQRELPVGIEEIASEAVAENLTYLRALSSVNDQISIPLAAPITRIMIGATRALDSDKVKLTLIICFAGKRPNIVGMMDFAPEASAGSRDGGTFDRFASAPLAKEIHQIINAPIPGPPSAELRDIWCHPEKFEPLGQVVQTSLDAVAAAVGKNLVACIPDQAIDGFVNEKAMLSPRDMLRTGGMRVDDSSASVIVSPIEFAPAIEDRSDRKALGAYMRAIDREGASSLEAETEFARSRSFACGLRGLELDWMAIGSPRSVLELYDQNFPFWLPYYADLSPELQRIASRRMLKANEIPDSLRDGFIGCLTNQTIANEAGLFMPGNAFDAADFSDLDRPEMIPGFGVSFDIITNYNLVVYERDGQKPRQMGSTEIAIQHWKGDDIDPSFAASHLFVGQKRRELRVRVNLGVQSTAPGAFQLSIALSTNDQVPMGNRVNGSLSPSDWQNLPDFLLAEVQKEHLEHVKSGGTSQ